MHVGDEIAQLVRGHVIENFGKIVTSDHNFHYIQLEKKLFKIDPRDSVMRKIKVLNVANTKLKHKYNIEVTKRMDQLNLDRRINKVVNHNAKETLQHIRTDWTKMLVLS